MNLFINAVSPKTDLLLFNQDREIIKTYSWGIKGNESSTLIPKIDDFIKSNNLDYKDITNIITVNGPGSFTGIRTIILAINTIAYITNTRLTKLSFFELFKGYPIIKPSSKRDCFVQFNKESGIEIIENNDLKNILKNKKIKKIYGELNKDLFEDIEAIEKIDYKSIIKNIRLDSLKQIKALYIKKPNIS